MTIQKSVLLELSGVCKSFAGTPVLKGIHLKVYSGDVHVLLGENGAGKSTLIKLLTGAHSKDKGGMSWKGKSFEIKNPMDAITKGISCIYQELNLVPELTVHENIFLGRELRKKYGTFLDISTMKEKTAAYIKKLGLELSPDAKISSLGMGQKQLVEIARALSMDAELIIMDEPTSSLSEGEVETFLKTVEELRKQGIAIVYISHKLEELRKVGDRISILRDGSIIGTYPMDEITTDQMIQQMVGRSLKEKYPGRQRVMGKEGLRVENLRRKGSQHSVSFTAYQGQILGITGLVGAGRTQLAKAVFGIDKIDFGDIYVFGEQVEIKSPREALQVGIAFIPENRKEEGLILDQSIEFNLSLTTVYRHFFMKRNELRDQTQTYIDELRISPKDRTRPVGKLSGGNQQKIVIGKWLATKAKIYLFDEPTRGIDVGAKVHVYELLNSLVDQGAVVIIISSELPEILSVCDRVLVMREGQITGDFQCKETSREGIMKAATGGFICNQHR